MYEPNEDKYGFKPKNRQELYALIDTILDSEHDYSTSTESIADAAVAAFNLVAKELGCTGFQASWAGLQVIKKTRGLEGPFTLVNLEDTLYPQYDVVGRVQEFIDENRDWQRQEAKKLLKNRDYASEIVVEHWKMLAQEATL